MLFHSVLHNFDLPFPLMLLAAVIILSETNLVAPYRLTGAQALSVDNATTNATLLASAA